jgi:hypothetical protein
MTGHDDALPENRYIFLPLAKEIRSRKLRNTHPASEIYRGTIDSY